MGGRRTLLLTASALAGLLLVTAVTGLSAANSVPPTKAGEDIRSIGPNDLKPPECAALTLTAQLTGSGAITGTGSAELILGSSIVDTVNAGGGTDCVLGGDLADALRGEGGSDVLLGGPGADTLSGGSGNDTCYGGPDTDTFASCETQVQ